MPGTIELPGSTLSDNESGLALEPVRERLAAAVLLLEDKDLRKLERHRRLLESSMARHLGLLGQVRVQVAASKPETQAEAQELRVKLRLVK